MMGTGHTMKLILFGCARNADEMKRIIAEMPGYEIIAVADNNQARWGSVFRGFHVISPAEMYQEILQDEELFIVIISRAYIEICQQLQHMQIERIYININDFLSHNKKHLGEYGRTAYKQEESVYEENSDYLLISNGGFPSSQNIYRSGFVLQRLIAYRESGLKVDAFGFRKYDGIGGYTYQGIPIYEGGGAELVQILRARTYKKVMVHFIDRNLYFYIRKELEGTDTSLIVWCHGYEILKWDRRRFNYAGHEIDEAALEREWLERKLFYQNVFLKRRIQFVFVSEWLKQVACSDIGQEPGSYYIVPNYINHELFQYIRKNADQRKKVLLIKSHHTRMYGNDISAEAIIELSNRECFSDMEFMLCGDGKLFDENMEALVEKQFPNVHIYRGFLSQEEIALRHREYGVFLCPTRQDTQGVSMGEAMCSGMAVITNRVAAVPEYIDDTSGILCENENVVEMADAMETLYNNPILFLQLSENAARRVREQCGYDKTIRVESVLIQNAKT